MAPQRTWADCVVADVNAAGGQVAVLDLEKADVAAVADVLANADVAISGRARGLGAASGVGVTDDRPQLVRCGS